MNFGYPKWVLDPILHGYQGITLSVFTKWKKSEEDFHFYQKKKKGKKQNIGFGVCFAECGRYGGSMHPCRESGTLSSFPELQTASQHQAAVALSSVCGHLCFISIYSVYPLTQNILSVPR